MSEISFPPQYVLTLNLLGSNKVLCILRYGGTADLAFSFDSHYPNKHGIASIVVMTKKKEPNELDRRTHCSVR